MILRKKSVNNFGNILRIKEIKKSFKRIPNFLSNIRKPVKILRTLILTFEDNLRIIQKILQNILPQTFL